MERPSQDNLITKYKHGSYKINWMWGKQRQEREFIGYNFYSYSPQKFLWKHSQSFTLLKKVVASIITKKLMVM